MGRDVPIIRSAIGYQLFGLKISISVISNCVEMNGFSYISAFITYYIHSCVRVYTVLLTHIN